MIFFFFWGLGGNLFWCFNFEFFKEKEKRKGKGIYFGQRKKKKKGKFAICELQMVVVVVDQILHFVWAEVPNHQTKWPKQFYAEKNKGRKDQ